jgi:hypothetical protein
MSYGKFEKPMRKARRSNRRDAEFYAINVTTVTEQPAELQNGEELILK